MSTNADDCDSGPPKYAALVVMFTLAVVGVGLSLSQGRAPMQTRVQSERAEIKIDVNLAAEDQLMLLPRIGPVLAQRIVEDRDARGHFRTIEDLDRVRGIGPRTIELIRPFITVGGEPAPSK